MRLWVCQIAVGGCVLLVGCGTTRWSDTARTATEQLLISDALDRAVSQVDFGVLEGKKTFLDTTPVTIALDNAYLSSLLRQQLLASGVVLVPRREDATYILEVRAGAVGTDRRDVLFGVPAAKVGGVVAVPGVPESIPEIPLAKKTEQRAVAKIAVFAYHRETGKPLWQSGTVPVESRARDIWILGAGPFHKGTIYEGKKPAGKKVKSPLLTKKDDDEKTGSSVREERHFDDPEKLKAREEQLAKAAEAAKAAKAVADDKKAPSCVVPATYVAPATPAPQPSPAPATPAPPPGPQPPSTVTEGSTPTVTPETLQALQKAADALSSRAHP